MNITKGWDEISYDEREYYLSKARYLISRGYITEIKDSNELARNMYNADCKNTKGR